MGAACCKDASNVEDTHYGEIENSKPTNYFTARKAADFALDLVEEYNRFNLASQTSGGLHHGTFVLHTGSVDLRPLLLRSDCMYQRESPHPFPGHRLQFGVDLPKPIEWDCGDEVKVIRHVMFATYKVHGDFFLAIRPERFSAKGLGKLSLCCATCSHQCKTTFGGCCTSNYEDEEKVAQDADHTERFVRFLHKLLSKEELSRVRSPAARLRRENQINDLLNNSRLYDFFVWEQRAILQELVSKLEFGDSIVQDFTRGVALQLGLHESDLEHEHSFRFRLGCESFFSIKAARIFFQNCLVKWPGGVGTEDLIGDDEKYMWHPSRMVEDSYHSDQFDDDSDVKKDDHLDVDTTADDAKKEGAYYEHKSLEVEHASDLSMRPTHGSHSVLSI